MYGLDKDLWPMQANRFITSKGGVGDDLDHNVLVNSTHNFTTLSISLFPNCAKYIKDMVEISAICE